MNIFLYKLGYSFIFNNRFNRSILIKSYGIISDNKLSFWVKDDIDDKWTNEYRKNREIRDKKYSEIIRKKYSDIDKYEDDIKADELELFYKNDRMKD